MNNQYFDCSPLLGDCFEVARNREKFPEMVDFRLTRMLIKALGVSTFKEAFLGEGTGALFAFVINVA